MREFTVRYRNGKINIKVDRQHRLLTGGTISAAMVRQIIDVINPELQAVFGDYQWSLQGSSGNYAIIATSGKHAFIESQGKTPAAAFCNCYQIIHVLID